MLVFNAQKLNNAVKETVRAAEAASIRVRLVPISFCFLFASLSFCFSFFLLLFLSASLHNVSSSLRSDAGFKLKWVRKQPWFHQ